MNWHRTLYDIYQKLEANGYRDISESLHNEQLTGGTGGEVLDLILSALLHIKDTRTDVYTVIRKEADELIVYGKSLGYL